MASGALRIRQSAAADCDYAAWSPDGTTIACNRLEWGMPDRPSSERLLLIDAQSGEARDLAPQWEHAIHSLCWARDGSALFANADERGHTPGFRIDLDGTVTRLTVDGAYSHLCPSPDGSTLYTLRSHPDSPPAPVALDPRAADQSPRGLPGPLDTPPALPARLEEVTTRGRDGVELRGWLVVPEGASPSQPAPLLLAIHGGPFASWSGWHWRWNPNLLAAQG